MKRMALSPSLSSKSSPSTPCSSSASLTSPASARLSSTSRIDPSLSVGAISSRLSAVERKVKRRAPSGVGFHPDAPASPLDNSLADSEPHSGSGVFGSAVKTFEYSKDLLLKLRFDPDPVVLNGKQPIAALAASCNMDAWRIRSAIMDGVADQILKDLFQLKLEHAHARKIGARDRGAAFGDGNLQI